MAVLNEQKFQQLREANEKGIVVGLRDVSSDSVVSRLDIDTFLSKFPKAFNLFIIAFDDLQQNDQSITGYAQLAGIHGLPRAGWDGMGLKDNNFKNEKNESFKSGYCAHGEARFPTWHRPYLALLEQTLFIRIVDLAKGFTGKIGGQYLDEALHFRLPFWDYFRPRGGSVKFPGLYRENGDNSPLSTTFDYDYSLPRIFTEKKLRVRRPPDNTLEQLGRNPFNSFDFTRANIIPPDDWDLYPKNVKTFPRDRTVRYRVPDSGNFAESPVVANMVLNEFRMDSNRLALSMLSNQERDLYNQYDVFATDSKDPHVGAPGAAGLAKRGADYASGSLESLHGLYHGLVGGFPNNVYKVWAGHMSQVPVAAFDPVFWFHHCQIDRLFALWQATHEHNGEKDWFKSKNLAKKELLPFRILNDLNDLKTCWNSNQCRNSESLGYDYPETVDGGDVLKRVREMYQWSVNLTAAGNFGDIPPDMVPVDVKDFEIWIEGSKGDLLSTTNPGPGPMLRTEVHSQMIVQNPSLPSFESGFSREWYIDNEVERLAFNGSFTIYYFINDVGSSISLGTDLATEPTLAGLTHVFAAPRETCDNCGEQALQGHVVTNTTPVTSMLLDYVETGHLESLHPDHVGPFLIRTLKWRIVTVDALKKDPRNATRDHGLKVNISCKKARLPRDSGDIEYEQYPEWIEQIKTNASATPTA